MTRNRYAVTVIVLNSGVVFLSYMLMVCVLQISFIISCLFLIILSILAFPAKLHAIRVLLCEICQIIPSPRLFVLGFCIAVNFI